MNRTLTSEANGRQPEHGTGEEHTLTCGEEMDTEENRDSTRATLLEILEDRAARILENEKDISAVERVLAILDAKQRTGDEAELGAEEADEADKVEEGTEATDEPEATDEAEVTGPKPLPQGDRRAGQRAAATRSTSGRCRSNDNRQARTFPRTTREFADGSAGHRRSGSTSARHG